MCFVWGRARVWIKHTASSAFCTPTHISPLPNRKKTKTKKRIPNKTDFSRYKRKIGRFFARSSHLLLLLHPFGISFLPFFRLSHLVWFRYSFGSVTLSTYVIWQQFASSYHPEKICVSCHFMYCTRIFYIVRAIRTHTPTVNACRKKHINQLCALFEILLLGALASIRRIAFIMIRHLAKCSMRVRFLKKCFFFLFFNLIFPLPPSSQCAIE